MRHRGLISGVLAFVAAIGAGTAAFAVDDGNQIQVLFSSATGLAWSEPPVDPDAHQAFNIYTGDLQTLRDTGVYTQSSSPSEPLPRLCDVIGPSISLDGTPEPGQCLFILVSGNRGAEPSVEGGLGTDGDGEWRPNSQGCHASLDTTPPEPPGPPTLTRGHCDAFLVAWKPSPSEDVTSYRLLFGTTPGNLGSSISPARSPTYLSLPGAVTYYVALRAVDSSGNVSADSLSSTAIPIDMTTPSPPVGSASVEDNGIRIDWTPVTTNVDNVPGDPDSPMIRDLSGYLLYRGDSPSDLGSAAPIVNDHYLTWSKSTWLDAPVVGCHTYYYALTAVDRCRNQSALSQDFKAAITTTIAPKAPANVRAMLAGTTRANVLWDPVTSDAEGHAVLVGHYDVYRSPAMSRDDPSPPEFPSTPVATVATTSFVDSTVPPLDELSQTVHYMVKAKDECVNESAASSPAAAACAFSGTVQIEGPTDGGSIAGRVFVTVSVVGGTDSYTGVTITYKHDQVGLTRTFTSSTTGTAWADTGWLASPAGEYAITATVTSASGCTSSRTITVKAVNTVGCCLSLFPTTNTIATCAGGATRCKEVSYRIGNNQCLTAVSLQEMTVGWTDYSGNHPRWVTARFNGTSIAAAGSWTTSYGGSPNEVGTATKANFSLPSPQVPYQSPMTTANTTVVTYVFDKATDSGFGPNRKVDVFGTNQFRFVLLDSAGNPSDITTTCDLPTLTVN